MNLQLIILDTKSMLLSKRAIYSIIFLAIFALAFAAMVEFSPEGLRTALESAAPEGSAGVFEYIWFEDVLKLLLLMVVSFGAFMISDLEDDGTLDINLARPESRANFLVRRTISAVLSFIIVFIAGSLVAGIIAWAIMGDLDLLLFIAHQLMIVPMLLFVLALTFFFSVPLRNITYTVLAGFASSLFLSFTYSFGLMANPGSEPSIFNPLALGYRVMAGQPLAEALVVVLAATVVLFLVGAAWFVKKDV
ncbi:MAG: hypothetical protein KKH41_01610 [Candidatus Thermoplasmatota archaeon]|nr:hypothetical protein [Euryarchaeota archaeon]MBU4032263.1 hypothetical protein [Candidatus Thermoplasmatota archaeon]MBU4070696.1 hypothetical protein [Candidatus Thermoplasmatota archaeon]MBU4145260.1 hypothetical protein [Candidatus Thermoplasmatota archaeon]MBU4591258.1 hypothetical protein [Candidatus Thermoplasmatota archaeon]